MSRKRDVGDKNINYQNLSKFKENLDNIIPKRKTLTQAEYDLLSYEEKHNGTVYFITDGVANITEEDKEYIDGQDTQTLTTAKEYTDTKISDLINGAPSTLDTLGEIAQAMSDNKDVVEALDEAIGTKATATDLITHTGSKTNPHGVTKAQVGLDKVENKSSADIRGELTKSDVTTALGYTPPTTNTTYSAATQSDNGLLSKEDKTKLDGIASEANKYTLPTAAKDTLGGVKTISTVTSTTGLTASPIINGVPYYKNTTYSNATTTTSGLMSSTDKTKLDGLDLSVFSWGNKYTIPAATGADGTQVKIPINGMINKNNYCLLFIIGAYSALYFINYALESRQELVWGDGAKFEISRTNGYEIGVRCKANNTYSHTCYVINIETNNAKSD